MQLAAHHYRIPYFQKLEYEVNTLISIGLLISGLLSFIIFFGLVLWYLKTYTFGLQQRHLSVRLSALELQARGFARSVPLDLEQDEKVSLIKELDNLLLIQSIKRQIDKSGLNIQANHLFFGMIGSGVITTLIILFFTSSWSVAFLIGIIGCATPYGLLLLVIQRRQALLQKQLPDLMDFMARSLQVGHSLNNTLQMAAADAPLPISAEFKRVFEELNYGSPMQKVLLGLSSRIDCAEVRYFVIAVIVNREIGGDLAEILKRVSKLIRERIDMQQTLRVLTSEGRASALILGALPFAIAGLIFFIQPNSYELMLNHPLGQNLLMYAGILMLVGFVWMKRLCTLRQ